MTALFNGLILRWQNNLVIKSFKCGNNAPLIKAVAKQIVVTAWHAIVVLDSDLEVTKRLKSVDGMPVYLDATSTYIAYGTNKGKVAFYFRHGSNEPTVSSKNTILIFRFLGL